nr:hypothetical protein [uncultured archaeon]
MEIKSYFNTNEKEIKSKKFNIFIGISLGNKYFSKENIKKYILWALENTKEDVLILIVDKIHSINYEILNKYTKNRAESVALKKGIEMKQSVEKIIRNLPKEKQKLVKICLWDSITKSKTYKQSIPFIHKEFKENKLFHECIMKIVKENLGNKTNKLNEEELDKLAFYVLDELPILIQGVEFENKIYTLHPYPGFSLLEDLILGLQKGTMFSSLSKKLNIKNKTAEVEAYIDDSIIPG